MRFAFAIYLSVVLCLGANAWKQPVKADIAVKKADVTIKKFLKSAGPILADPEDGHLGKYSGPEEESEPRSASIEEAPASHERRHTEVREVDHEKVPASESSEPESKESHHVGRSVILTLGGMMIIASITFAMANSLNAKLKKYTWCTLDNVVCIFLAVMVFQAVDEAVVDSGVIKEDHIRVASFLYAVFALLTAIGLSFLLKGVPAQLAVFTAASAHFVSFAFMHAASVQMELNADHVTHAIWVFVGLLIVMPLLFAASFFLKQHIGITANPELSEKIDDVENDAGAMAAAISWTYVVCFIISGEFQNVEEAEEVDRGERKAMLIYAIVISVIGAAYVIMTSSGTEERQPSGSYVGKRTRAFFSSFAAMCVAWAFLLWGKWTFHGHHFAAVPILGRVVFAMVATLVGLAIITAMAYTIAHTGTNDSHKLHALLLSVVGLLIGWSWEEVFDAGLESLAGEREAPDHVGNVKIVAMLVMLVVILPVHVIYFKPIVMKLDEE